MKAHLITVDLTDHGCMFIQDDLRNDAHFEHAAKRSGDTFSWITTDGSLQIDFGGNTNAEHPFTMNGPYVAASGVPTNPVTVDPTKGARSYKYQITVTDAGGNKSVEDPQVIIDPGTFMGPGEWELRNQDSGALLLLGAARGGVNEVAKDVIRNIIADLAGASPSKADAPKFFENGIELISVDVEAAGVKVLVTVAGPKAPNK